MTAFVVIDYDPTWPQVFARVREELLHGFASTPVAIAHIGSTAVPGLAAKPVIDVLVGAESLAAIEARMPALADGGYRYVSAYEREIPDRRYFVKDAVDGRRVHVHAVVDGSTLHRDHLAFRDALRADPALRERYQSLKRTLARTYAHDKSAYVEAKAPFIRAVLASAACPAHRQQET